MAWSLVLSRGAVLLLAICANSATPLVLADSITIAANDSRVQLPPVAPVRPKEVYFGKVNGEDRGPNPMDPPKVLVDDYDWLYDPHRNSSEGTAYLKAETSYFQHMTQHLANASRHLLALTTKFSGETSKTSRSQQYHTHTLQRRYDGSLMRRHGRDRPAPSSRHLKVDQEENDVTGELRKRLCKDKDFCATFFAYSEDNALLAFGVDYEGDELYSLRFMNASSREEFNERIDMVPSSSCSWSSAATTTVFYYTTGVGPNRSDKLWRHVPGTAVSTDELLFEAEDKDDYVYVSQITHRYVIFSVTSWNYYVTWFIDLEVDGRLPRVMEPRTDLFLYQPTLSGTDTLYIIASEVGQNGKLLMGNISEPSRKNWKEIPVSEDSTVDLTSVVCCATRCAVLGRQGPRFGLWILDKDAALPVADFREGNETFALSPFCKDSDGATDILLVIYESRITPPKTFEVDMLTGEKTFISQQAIPNFRRDDFVVEDLLVRSHDGAEVPMSVLYKKSLKKPQGVPQATILYGYGGFQVPLDPFFSSTNLALAELGVILVTANVRGGTEKGQSWWADGRLLKKKNSFYDFIACAERLIEMNYTSSDLLALSGGSNGGLLVSAVTTMRPDLAKVVLCQVPVADPLTTLSRDFYYAGEYGNANQAEHFENLLSYSPYSNIKEVAYPTMVVTTSFYDARVGYWEPAKLVAKFRQKKTDSNLLLFNAPITGGHGGQDYYKDFAIYHAFVLEQLGVVVVAGQNKSSYTNTSSSSTAPGF